MHYLLCEHTCFGHMDKGTHHMFSGLFIQSWKREEEEEKSYILSQENEHISQFWQRKKFPVLYCFK